MWNYTIFHDQNPSSQKQHMEKSSKSKDTVCLSLLRFCGKSYEVWSNNYKIFKEMPVLRTKFHNSAMVRVKIGKTARVYEQSPITLQWMKWKSSKSKATVKSPTIRLCKNDVKFGQRKLELKVKYNFHAEKVIEKITFNKCVECNKLTKLDSYQNEMANCCI